MLLTEFNICHYLMEKGLVPVQAVVDGFFSARRMESRHNNFLINREFDKNRLFVKQAKLPDPEKEESVFAEAAVCQLFDSRDTFKSLASAVPDFIYYDAAEAVLVTGQVNGISVQEKYFLAGSDELPAAKMARILALLHSIKDESIIHEPGGSLRAIKPGVFSLSEKERMNFKISGSQADEQAVELISRNKEFISFIDKASKDWLFSCFIHYDCKFNNFLVDDKENLTLVDWELAGPGDPAWDIAGIFHSYLLLQTDSRLVNHFAVLPDFKKESGIFWTTYQEAMHFSKTEGKSFLLKSVSFTGMRLIQAAFESNQQVKKLGMDTAKLLQLSLNILRSPEKAASELFGLN